jgi:hypothetical protein
MSTNPLDDFIQQVVRNLPEGVQQLRDDAGRNLRAGLEAGLKKLDLVTRVEFDVQRQLLERAQQQLKLLEDKLTELEAQLNQRNP